MVTTSTLRAPHDTSVHSQGVDHIQGYATWLHEVGVVILYYPMTQKNHILCYTLYAHYCKQGHWSTLISVKFVSYCIDLFQAMIFHRKQATRWPPFSNASGSHVWSMLYHSFTLITYLIVAGTNSQLLCNGTLRSTTCTCRSEELELILQQNKSEHAVMNSIQSVFSKTWLNNDCDTPWLIGWGS